MSTSLQPIDQMAPGANLAAYVQAVSAIPVLSVERERELAEDLFYNDNLDAARELVMSHLRFVVHIARSYSGYGLAEGDLIQEGNVGLMKAVKRFDPEKGVRLVSFAVHWIKADVAQVHPAQLAHRESGDDQGAAQVVLQPAQQEEGACMAERGRGPGGR